MPQYIVKNRKTDKSKKYPKSPIFQGFFEHFSLICYMVFFTFFVQSLHECKIIQGRNLPTDFGIWQIFFDYTEKLLGFLTVIGRKAALDQVALVTVGLQEVLL